MAAEILAAARGGAEALEIRDIPAPAPGPGQILAEAGEARERLKAGRARGKVAPIP